MPAQKKTHADHVVTTRVGVGEHTGNPTTHLSLEKRQTNRFNAATSPVTSETPRPKKNNTDPSTNEKRSRATYCSNMQIGPVLKKATAGNSSKL